MKRSPSESTCFGNPAGGVITSQESAPEIVFVIYLSIVYNYILILYILIEFIHFFLFFLLI